jgi:hypothetical protein
VANTDECARLVSSFEPGFLPIDTRWCVSVRTLFGLAHRPRSDRRAVSVECALSLQHGCLRLGVRIATSVHSETETRAIHGEPSPHSRFKRLVARLIREGHSPSPPPSLDSTARLYNAWIALRRCKKSCRPKSGSETIILARIKFDFRGEAQRRRSEEGITF